MSDPVELQEDDAGRARRPGALAAAPAVGEWRTATEIALLVRCDPWTVAEHLNNGTLHGHVGSVQWWVRGAVVDAFLEGLDVAAQQRACGCRTLRLVHGSRRDLMSAGPRVSGTHSAAGARSRPIEG